MVEMAKVKTSIFLTVVTGNMFMLLSSMTISGVAMEIREIFEKDLAVHTDWMTKIALFGAVIGALLFCGIADILGRKITLLIIGLFMFITFVMNMVTFEHKGLILLGRCVQGMCFGGVYGVLPIYLAEIAEKSSRGLVMSTALLTYQLGQLLMIFVQWFATFFVYNTVMAILAVLSSILFYFFGHETPYYLVKKNKENIAKIVLEKIRNSSQNKIDDELDDILGRAAESGKEKIMTCFKGNGWLKSLVILIALNHLAHLSGSTFIFLQSHQFINDAFAGRTSFLYTGLTIGILQASISVDPATLPTFLTSSQVFKVTDKDTVVLPCEVSNLGPYVLVWKKGIAVLSAGNVKVSPDPRMRLVHGYSLEIREVGPQDAGDYVCQIGTLEPREITHTVEILVPPRIHYVTSDGRVEVKKGSSMKLECKASGNPTPKITWSRKNNLLPDGVQTAVTPVLALERVDRHQAGVYQCTASNGVGEDVSEQIVVHVLSVSQAEIKEK